MNDFSQKCTRGKNLWKTRASAIKNILDAVNSAATTPGVPSIRAPESPVALSLTKVTEEPHGQLLPSNLRSKLRFLVGHRSHSFIFSCGANQSINLTDVT